MTHTNAIPTPNDRRRTLARQVASLTVAVAACGSAAFVATTPWAVDAAEPPPSAMFVPVASCRLFDTRAGEPPAGGRKSPLTAGEIVTQQVTGPIGNCNVPSDAVAVAMNVTIAGPTADSFLQVYPADIDDPGVSNLNYVAGQAPTPNWVDVRLSPGGAVKLMNYAGTVDVLADVAGYYTPAGPAQLGADEGLAARVDELEALLDTALDRIGTAEDRLDGLDASRPFVVVDSKGASNTPVPTTYTAYNKVTVTAPTDGIVTITSHAVVKHDVEGGSVRCGIVPSADPAVPNFAHVSAQIYGRASGWGGASTIAGTRAFEMTAGETTDFQMTCIGWPVGGTISARNLVATFIPTP